MAEDVALGLLIALEHAQGVLHLGGPERISRYGFGLLMADIFHLPRTALVPTRQADIPMAAPRPADLSCDSRRAFALGYAPRPPRAGLTAIARP